MMEGARFEWFGGRRSLDVFDTFADLVEVLDRLADLAVAHPAFDRPARSRQTSASAFASRRTWLRPVDRQQSETPMGGHG